MSGSSSNSLGVKVAGPDTRLIMQRPRFNDTRLRGRAWQLPEVNAVGIESHHQRHPSYYQPVMMEEFHYAGRALDMVLVDVGNKRHNSLYPGKLAQLAYYGALFDWCYFSRQGHVHCSVKPGMMSLFFTTENGYILPLLVSLMATAVRRLISSIH